METTTDLHQSAPATAPDEHRPSRDPAVGQAAGRFISIRTKVTAALLLVALLPLVAASTVAYLSARQSGEAQAVERLSGIAAVQEERVNTYASSSLETLALVASRTQLRISFAAELAEPDPANVELMQRILGDATMSSATALRIELVDLEGRVVASSDGAELGADRSGAPAFQRGRDNPDLSTIAERDGERVGVHGRSVELEGVELGVVLIEASLAPLDRLMTDYTGLGDSGETILASARDLESVELLGPVRFPEELADENVVGSDLMAPALGGPEGLVEGRLDYRGEEVLATTRAVDRVPGWALTVKIDRREALADANRLRNLLLAVLGVATVAVLVGSSLLARAMTRPVIELHRTALAVAGGQSGRRAHVATNDELRTLADEFNRMTSELVDANARLQATNEHLEEFVYISSHDLKSPLRSISSFSQLLQADYGGRLDDEGQEYLGFIQEGSSRMHAVIEDLLDYLRVEKADQLVEQVDLDEVLDHALLLHGPLLDSVGTVIQAGPLPTVDGNASLLGQLLGNLVQNSVRYRHPDRAPLLDIGAERDGDSWRITIADNGLGVPADRREQAFEVFRRLSDGGEGTGMGLAICRRIARRHGGDITMADSPHGGVALVVRLPVRSRTT